VHQRLFFCCLVILLIFTGIQCRQPKRVYHFTRFSMDTIVEYTLLAPDRSVALAAVNAAHQEVERLDSLFWEENPNSPIYQVNQIHHSVTVPDTIFQFLQRVRQYWQITGGLFDPSIKPVLDLYQLDAQSPVPPDSQQINSVLPLVGFQQFSLQPRRRIVKQHAHNALTLGGVAKGYIVDRAVAILKQYGITGGIVNAGGDLKCWRNDHRYWHIGIQHPRKSTILAVLKLQNGAVATSGDYQRFYIFKGKRYHHLIDPRNGRPGRLSQSATVIATTTEMADAMATAAFLMGASKAMQWANQRPDIHVLLVDASGTLHISHGMQNYLLEVDQNEVP